MRNNWFYLVWEIPLALLSFLFYKGMKFVIGNLYTIYLFGDRQKACQWRVLSAESLQNFLSLPVLMTKGPRWNTHAIIGTLGPFVVKKTLAIASETANSSAGSWIAVIYSFPSYATIAYLESEKIASSEKWTTLSLKPGRYTIGLRYYHQQKELALPAIKVDDGDFVGATKIANNVNDFYRDLAAKTNWFYLALHYYIFTILKLRNWLPQKFVEREYLPVGAPDTYFYYNYLEKGQILEIETEREFLEKYDLYFTLYNRASLPLESYYFEQQEYKTSNDRHDGYYLFRVRSKVERQTDLVVDFQLTSQDTHSPKLAIREIQDTFSKN
jgi:hypothetical protein